MTAQEAYILAKAYTNKSIEGAGSLKGAACQIKSIEAITGGHRITFEWEDNDGEVSTDTMDVMDGADGSDGVGISSITYKETDAHGNYVYTVTLTDTNTYDIICPKGAQGETGATGATGNGIASIEKTSTAGLVDTYTITYTNGQTTTFTVTNGESITVDSAMSGSSTNPVQNKVITEALALKQNAEDNNLTTTSKTVVGGINELKSGLTNLDNEVNGDATTYPYAEVITIPDAIPANVADCNVKIEPVQDLHGYDHPWVGGAGKNKYSVLVGADAWNNNNASHTNDNGKLVITTNANIGTPGVYSDQTSVLRQYIINNRERTNVTVSFSVKSDNPCEIYYGLDTNPNSANISSTPQRLSYTYTSSMASGFVVYVVGTPTSNYTITVYDVQLEDSWEATPYEPYSNICPITGHTEASVQRDGKNLFDVNGNYINRQGAGGTYTVSGNSITVTSSTQTSAFAGFIKPLEVGETYTISYTSTSKIRILQIDEPITVITQGYYGSDTDSGTSFVASKPYVLINCVGNTSGVTYSNIQLEKGSSPTDYEPYHGKTYTIALSSTIYGGTVDFDSGVMTVTHEYVEYDGDENWTMFGSGSAIDYCVKCAIPNTAKYSATGFPNLISNELEVVQNTATWGNYNAFISQEQTTEYNRKFIECGVKGVSTTPEAWKTYLASNPLQVCYELATHTTIQLTPQQIQLLKGQNTLTASTGQISVTVNGVSGAIGSVQEQVNEIASDKQDKTDNTLTTTAKTVVGAINEVNSNISTLSGNLTNLGNRLDGLNSARITTNASGQNITITTTASKSVGLILVSNNNGQNAVFGFGYFVSDYAWNKIFGDDTALTITEASGVLTISGLSAWSAVTVISDQQFTLERVTPTP